MAWFKSESVQSGDGGVTELPTFTPDASPFADAAARDAYFAANLDELYNGDNPNYSYTLIELVSPSETERWSGTTNPGTYDSGLWITTTAGQIQSDLTETDSLSAAYVKGNERYKAFAGGVQFTNQSIASRNANALTQTLTSVPAGTYEIRVDFMLQVFSTTRNGQVVVELDGTPILTIPARTEMKDIFNALTFSMVSDDVALSGNHTIDVYYGHGTSNATCAIYDVKAVTKRVA